MWGHFNSLVLRCGAKVLALHSATTFSMIRELAIPVLVYIATRWRTAGWRNWREGLKPMGFWKEGRSVFLAIGVLVGLTIMTFMAVLPSVVYDDHMDLVSANRDLRKEAKILNDQIYEFKQRVSYKSAPVEQPAPRLRIMYNLSSLEGSTIIIPAPDGLLVDLSRFNIQNVGLYDTGGTVMRLYFSKGVRWTSGMLGLWVSTPSDDAAFPIEYYSTNLSGSGPIIHAGETLNWEPFIGTMVQLEDTLLPVQAKIKLFYGASRPAEATFFIKIEKVKLNQ